MASDKDVVIVAAVRTPFGRFGGSLANIDYYELGAIPMREVIKRAGVKPDVVNEVFWGVGDTSACRDPYTPVAARQSLIRAGLPHETVSISFDMACVSAMHAVKLAAMEMAAGEIETAIAGGAASFGQSPLVVRGLRFNGYRLTDVKMEDPLVALGYKDAISGAIAVNFMKELAKVLAPEVLGKELVIKDLKARGPNSNSQILGEFSFGARE